MPKFNVEKTITIHVPADKVFPFISDFNQWRSWSPWLILEPEAQVTVAPNGNSYEWQGKRIGQGKMTKITESPARELSCELLFLKPWKSKAQVKFFIKEDGANSQVTWIMDSSLPFFMFFMKKMMITQIGLDYDRGLAMLKDLAETNHVPSKLEFTGQTTFAGYSYVGIATNCAAQEIKEHMESDFHRLNQWEKQSANHLNGYPFTIYTKWDPVKGKVSYICGIPVQELPSDLPQEFVKGEIPKTDTYCITHFGPYRHLGNAWSAGMNLSQNKVFKENKKIHPFETYPHLPEEVNEGKVETKIYFPVK